MLGRMKRLITDALAATADAWSPIRRAYRWVWEASRILANREGHARRDVEQAFVKVLRSIGVTKRHCGPLEDVLTHFLKVTRSYRSGLFHCYDDADIPRTNNDLEHCFGQHRFHERRATGRKSGAPNAVLRGSVRLVASVASRLRQFVAVELAPHDHGQWRQIRQSVRRGFALRAQGRRFRHDPQAYLVQLEADYLKSALPA
jgi:hypothetical protein